MKRIIIGLICCAAIVASMQAQSDSTSQTSKLRPAQVTFITPIGTNGLDAGQYTNQISINIFSGYNGGLNGIEVGGFANVLKKDMVGLQVAGFSNAVWGRAEGGQFAGFANVTREAMTGIQGAGFTNTIVDSASAVQAAGFSNVVKGNLLGAQFSGFSNVTKGDMQGLQVSGFSNLTIGSMDGAQISGFSNVATEDLTGIQVSGFVNVAQKVTGSQIGFFNFADSVEQGAPIGFFSFVCKGHHKVEIGGGESFYAQANFKTGVRKFYNIFSAGAKIEGNTLFWAYGYGLGTQVPISDRFFMNADLLAYHVLQDGGAFEDLNMLNKLHIQASYALNDRFSIYSGGAINVYVTDRLDAEDNLMGRSIAPWSVYDNVINSTLVTIYPGFNLGVRL